MWRNGVFESVEERLSGVSVSVWEGRVCGGVGCERLFRKTY